MPRCFLTEAHFCYVFQGLLINLHRMKRKVMLIADKARYKFLTTYYFLTNNYISCLWKKRNANTIFTCCFLIPIVKENLYDMWQCALSTLWLHDYYYKCKQKQKQGILHVKIRLLNIIQRVKITKCKFFFTDGSGNIIYIAPLQKMQNIKWSWQNGIISVAFFKLLFQYSALYSLAIPSMILWQRVPQIGKSTLQMPELKIFLKNLELSRIWEILKQHKHIL